MHVILAAIGRLKKGPEQELVARYAARLSKTGRAIGISEFSTFEFAESRASTAELRKAEEAEMLLSRLPNGYNIFAFDERGTMPTSRKFASYVSSELDTGTSALALIIGGPDGLHDSVRQKAKKIIALGGVTYPHQIVRILVLEQMYRATTILTNHPYHRD